MEQKVWKKLKFYAVILEDKIGIFTDWQVVNKAICGHSNKQKRFQDYFKALKFIREKLSDEELRAYGIDKKNMAWDKWYFKDYIVGMKDRKDVNTQWKNIKK